jgi:hypothetical protein
LFSIACAPFLKNAGVVSVSLTKNPSGYPILFLTHLEGILTKKIGGGGSHTTRRTKHIRPVCPGQLGELLPYASRRGIFLPSDEGGKSRPTIYPERPRRGAAPRRILAPPIPRRLP